MLDYVQAKVVLARPKTPTSDKERVIVKLEDHELPLCMVYAPGWSTSEIEFKQRDETTTFTLAYVQAFQENESPNRSLMDTAEAITEQIWDANVLDTDAAGYFAQVTAWDIGKSRDNADRYALIMQVEFKTMDAVDSAFALTEA
jgi:hypothetical protein